MLQIAECVQGNTVTLMLSGRFDFNARKPFHTAMQQAQAPNLHEIILNFVSVGFIDSAGLGLLMLTKKNLFDPNCLLSLMVSQGYLQDVFELANMGKKSQITVLESSSSTPSSPTLC